MRKIFILSWFLLLAVHISAQEPFQWKNLKFDSSTAQNAVEVLGKPKKDKVEKVKFNKSVPANLRSQMNFRKLQYENIDEFKDVDLLFLNEKLFGIELNPHRRKLFAIDLSKMYNMDFLLTEGLPKEVNWTDYENQKETTIPKVYPPSYFMISVKSDCAIIATIDNNTWKAFWRDSLKKPTTEMFPGFVDKIQIFSRKSEGK